MHCLFGIHQVRDERLYFSYKLCTIILRISKAIGELKPRIICPLILSDKISRIA